MGECSCPECANDRYEPPRLQFEDSLALERIAVALEKIAVAIEGPNKTVVDGSS